jgi:hypothetical protein
VFLYKSSLNKAAHPSNFTVAKQRAVILVRACACVCVCVCVSVSGSVLWSGNMDDDEERTASGISLGTGNI